MRWEAVCTKRWFSDLKFGNLGFPGSQSTEQRLGYCGSHHLCTLSIKLVSGHLVLSSRHSACQGSRCFGLQTLVYDLGDSSQKELTGLFGGRHNSSQKGWTTHYKLQAVLDDREKNKCKKGETSRNMIHLVFFLIRKHFSLSIFIFWEFHTWVI